MIKYSVEKFEDIYGELKPLLEKHYEEVAMYQDKIAFDPDYDKYAELEKLGMLHIVTARSKDLSLIGYFVTLITPNLHYKQDLYGFNDIVYIKDSYRKSKAGLDMFKFAECELKKLGVSVMTVHMKTKIPFDALCEGLGYDYAERLYTKYIGDK